MRALTEDVIAGARSALPDSDRDEEPQLLDTGFSNVVLRFGGTVVRVARHEDARRGHHREARSIEVVRTRLPVRVPHPYRVVEPSEALPFGAALYPRLPGRAMTAGDVAQRPALAVKIADVLAALHATPPSAFPSATVPDLEPTPRFEWLLAQTGGLLRSRLSGDLLRSLDALVARAHHVLPGRTRVVCHGDAWFGNMLVTPDGTLSALLDFEDMCIADPALDLAAQTHLEAPGAAQTIDAYLARTGPLDALQERIECYRVLFELSGLAYCLRNDLDEEVADVIAKLTRILSS